MKNSKELNNILEAIQKYIEKHKGDVQFVGSFLAFKGKDFDVVDDICLAYGIKDSLRESIKEMDEMIEKEKEDFVNW